MSTFTATPQQVERVIAAVLPHTAADGYVPVITCVRIEILGTQFIAAATDRYTLGVAWAALSDWKDDAEPTDGAQACIFAADWRRLFTFLKPHKKAEATWVLTPDALTVSVDDRQESLTVRTVDVDFPKWRTIIGSQLEKSATGTPTLNFNPRKIENFTASAKALGVGPGGMSWRFASKPADPAIVRIGANFLGLLMPVRADELPVLDLAPLGIESAPAVAA